MLKSFKAIKLSVKTTRLRLHLYCCVNIIRKSIKLSFFLLSFLVDSLFFFSPHAELNVMLKIAIFCCVYMSFIKATEIEDNCIMEFLKQRNLISSTATNPNYYRRQNCDTVVTRVVRNIYEENYDYVEENAAVDNRTYRNCLKSEFDRHKMNEKFLKTKALDYEPQRTKLEKIQDDLLQNIKSFCSRKFAQVASQRFEDFFTKVGGLSLRMLNHPAVVKIKENLACMNLYAIEKKLLDPAVYDLNVKLINQTEDDCKYAEYDVRDMIMDEWHIRRVSEDDEIQRCFIGIFLETQAVDFFIKNSLLNHLQLTQEQKDFEREKFVESSSIVHEMSYKCMSNGFEKI